MGYVARIVIFPCMELKNITTKSCNYAQIYYHLQFRTRIMYLW